METSKEYVIKLAQERKVKFVRLWFTDILGLLKSIAIPINELEDALYEGVRFDGSTLNGFIRTDEHELIAIPDPSTFQILPWRPQEDSVARMFCNIYTSDLSFYEGDSRYVLRKNLKKAAEKGYTIYTGPEIEFFFFKNYKSPEILDHGGYFDLTPLDTASDYRRQTVLALEKMGIDIISSHHEGAYSQHEIDLRHEDALTTADNIMTFKLTAKEIAQKNDIYASFMPKPLANQNGSGMHIHLSVFKNDKNIFFDESKPHCLSNKGKNFIAGLLKHANEFFPITNQWINSYKRFIKGYEAPTFNAWTGGIPSALVRVPEIIKSKSNSMRIELRNPDPACNPYLAFSAIIAAGLKGIEENYTLEDSLEEMEEKSINKISPLPGHLSEALINLTDSKLMKETLGDFIVEKFIKNKLLELHEYNSHITDHEINRYLPIL